MASPHLEAVATFALGRARADLELPPLEVVWMVPGDPRWEWAAARGGAPAVVRSGIRGTGFYDESTPDKIYVVDLSESSLPRSLEQTRYLTTSTVATVGWDAHRHSPLRLRAVRA